MTLPWLALGFGTPSPPPSSTVSDIGPFISWLDANSELPGAAVILSRHRNTERQNLTGHVKQCFFASLRFFQEHPRFVTDTSDGLENLAPDKVYQTTSPGLQTAWAAHLDAHALDSGDSYSYATLRGILPPSFGGTRQGGGGGISTLKRLLPLVARWMREGHLGGS